MPSAAAVRVRFETERWRVAVNPAAVSGTTKIYFSDRIAGKLMKGPSLHYDTRVLRQFCCDACGRIVQAPAWATSRTCMCTNPPRFMRPLERPKTVSPDISRFITPVDPADEIEEEIDEVPYVAHVPIKPPPPPRFANRRKLYDDTATASEPDFGEGVTADAGEESTFGDDVADDSSPETSPSQPNDSTNNSGDESRRPRGRRRGRAVSNDGDRSGGIQRPPQAQRSSESERSAGSTQGPTSSGNPASRGSSAPDRAFGGERPARNERRPRRDRQENISSNRNQRGNRRPNNSNAPLIPSDSRNDSKSAVDVTGSVLNSDNDPDVVFPENAISEGTDSPSDAATPQGEGRPRRSRRRGRRRGSRPEGGGE